MGKSVELKRFRIQTKATAFSSGAPEASRRITLMENIVFLRSEENELSIVRVRDRIMYKSRMRIHFVHILRYTRISTDVSNTVEIVFLLRVTTTLSNRSDSCK